MIDGAFNVASKVREESTLEEKQSELKKRMFYDSTLEKQTKGAKRHKTLNFNTHGSYLQ